MNIKFKKHFDLSKQVLYHLAEFMAKGVDCYLELMPKQIHRKVFGYAESIAVEERFQERQRIKRALYEMKKRKLLEIKSKGGKIFYELTTKGSQEAFLIKTKFKKINSKGEYCLVCFDIPESVRKTRWAMRHFLKTAGFKLLQKSIWYTDKDVFDEIKNYIKSLRADQWVTVIRANSIENI